MTITAKSKRCPTCGKRQYIGPMKYGLTPALWRVAEQVYKGLSNKEIASALGIAEKTVKMHVVAINKMLGTNKRTQIILYVSKCMQDAAQE